MTDTHRSTILVIMFVLVLVMTSITVAQARIMPDAVGQMVLCTGISSEPILVHSEGQIFHGSDICVDFITKFVSLESEYQTGLYIFRIDFSDPVSIRIDISQIQYPYDWPLNRAPPV